MQAYKNTFSHIQTQARTHMKNQRFYVNTKPKTQDYTLCKKSEEKGNGEHKEKRIFKILVYIQQRIDSFGHFQTQTCS